jgi:type I restriction enzyme, R subunit
MPAETIIEVVNINDPDALKAVVEETGVSEASRADRIASATRGQSPKDGRGPDLLPQFSELLEETIRAYREAAFRARIPEQRRGPREQGGAQGSGPGCSGKHPGR